MRAHDSMIDGDDPTSPRERAQPFDASGRTYALGRSVARARDVDDLAEQIGSFIVSIWGSVLDLPLALASANGESSDAFELRVTVPLSGDRWVRVACGPQLGRVIGAHVFGNHIAEVDFASSRMAALELASAIATHAAVIEHPAWPWTSPTDSTTSPPERRTACEVWFESQGHRMAVALLSRAAPRTG